MIANQTELERSRTYLSVLESAVQELRERVRSQNRGRFAVMASSYLEEIKRVRFRIDEYVGISMALEDSNDFFVVFEGPSQLAGMAPAPMVTRSIGALQSGLRRIGEYVARAEHHVSESFTKYQLAKNFELSVATLTPGSLRVGLRIARPSEPTLPPDSAIESSRKFGEALKVVLRGADGIEQFRHILPDVSFQLQVLKAMLGIAPSKQKSDYHVLLGGRLIEDSPIVLGKEQRSYIAGLIRATAEEAVQEGVVIEINLEKRIFQIRSEVTLLRCHYRSELTDAAKAALDHRVKVIGTAKTYMDGSVRFIQVREIHLIPVE